MRVSEYIAAMTVTLSRSMELRLTISHIQASHCYNLCPC